MVGKRKATAANRGACGRTGAVVTMIVAGCMGQSAAHAQSNAQASEPLQSVADAGSQASANTALHDTIPPPPADAALPEVEPVISNDEFTAAVPALPADYDKELDQPLETLDEFEQRYADRQARGRGQTNEAREGEGREGREGSGPEVSGPDTDNAAIMAGANEVDPDAGDNAMSLSVHDSALAEPLQPLETFDVEPVELGEQDDAAGRSVTYASQVEGLDKLEGDLAADLGRIFKDLSSLRAGKGKAANSAMVRARMDEDAELLRRIMASEGWYDAKVHTQLERDRPDRSGRERTNERHLTAILTVEPGARYYFSDIVVQAKPTIPPDLIRSRLSLQTGDPVIAGNVLSAEAELALALPEAGYAFAKLGERDLLLDPDEGTGVYTLPVEIGPRSSFGGFATTGNLAFNTDHIQTLARFQAGELYDSRKVDDLRQALVATGLFSSVSVEPLHSGETAADGTEPVTLMVQQNEGPRRTIAGTVGYSSGEGFRVEGSWTDRNRFRPEGALIVTGVAGTNEQSAGVALRRSNAGKRDRTFEVGVQAARTNYSAYDAYTGKLSVRLSRDATPIWQKHWTWALGAQVLATAETVYDYSKAGTNRRTFYVAGASGELGMDYSDSLLNPTKGYRARVLIEPEGSINHGFDFYTRAILDASAYWPMGKGLVLAGRVRLGTLQGAALDNIAPSRRLYSGGGGSVRGYAYQKLGQLDPDGDPVGGRSLNEASLEARYRFGSFGLVSFVDVGQSYAQPVPQMTDLRYGVGVGARFYTDFGPFRLDVATPVNRRVGESRINVYVSIGQAF